MSRHRVFLESPEVSDGALTIEGPEADHASRSKRVRVGDEIDAMDGRGTIHRCRVETASRRGITLRVLESLRVEPVEPRLEVWSATPKGPRLDKMIDMLGQVGVAAWTPMHTRLGVVDPGAGKIERTRRITIETAKQCGRAHLMAIEPKASLDDALEAAPDLGLVIADASGSAYRPSGRSRVRLLVGPEGGFLPEEVEAARGAGAQVVSLGPHEQRIETACVGGAATILSLEQSSRRGA